MDGAPKESLQQAALRLLSGKAKRDGKTLERIDAIHTYHRADASPLFHRVRGVLEGGHKYILPIKQEGGRYQLGEPPKPPNGKPLYRLHELLAAPQDVVVVVTEGEKCADLLRARGVVATTSGGADSASTADWLPLAGRSVLIWPDADDAGTRYADKVDGLLRALGADVQRIDVAALGLTGKDDCEQYLERHPNTMAADVLALPVVEPPNGATLLDAVRDYLRTFVAYPSEHALVASTLWAAHAHAVHLCDNTPRLAYLSPEPESGKSRALEVLANLVPNPKLSISVTSAWLFRKIGGEEGMTLLFDEIDTVFGPRAGEHEDVRGMLNAGYRKGATAGRCVKQGTEVIAEEFPCYCAVAMAGLGSLPDTILTRSVIVRMRRRSPSEQVSPYRPRLHEAAGHRLRDQLAIWTRCTWPAGHVSVYPELPEGVEDRSADIWEPLLLMADAAGGAWPARARAAAVAMVKEGKADTPSLRVRLLADLRLIFGEATELATADILQRLKAIEDAPWKSIKGKELDAGRLSTMLRPYGVKPCNLRSMGKVLKGYRRCDLVDPWERYLPSLSKEAAAPATTATTVEAQGMDSSDPDGGARYIEQETRYTPNQPATREPLSGAMSADVAGVAGFQVNAESPDREGFDV